MSNDHPEQMPPDGTPEHRHIQMTNWQVVNCSTPANFFHVLRRQIRREFRKPLMVASPKSLLKLRACTSTREDFVNGEFHRVIPADNGSVADEDIKRVIFCSGKVYYDLKAEREKVGLEGKMALTR